jgi:hypothetical protein
MREVVPRGSLRGRCAEPLKPLLSAVTPCSCFVLETDHAPQSAYLPIIAESIGDNHSGMNCRF